MLTDQQKDARIDFLEQQNHSFRAQLFEVDELRKEASRIGWHVQRLEQKIRNQRTEIKNRRIQADEGARYMDWHHGLICLALGVKPSEKGRATAVSELIELARPAIASRAAVEQPL